MIYIFPCWESIAGHVVSFVLPGDEKANSSGSKAMVPFWGRCTTHFRTYFSGIGRFTGGTIWILTHGQTAASVDEEAWAAFQQLPAERRACAGHAAAALCQGFDSILVDALTGNRGLTGAGPGRGKTRRTPWCRFLTWISFASGFRFFFCQLVGTD